MQQVSSVMMSYHRRQMAKYGGCAGYQGDGSYIAGSLDIFAQRATTREGKIQVELAQLRYRATRLVGMRNSLSRLGGGIGTRGPGEKKLEVDRRLIRERISQLKRELEDVKRHREVARQQRLLVIIFRTTLCLVEITKSSS